MLPKNLLKQIRKLKLAEYRLYTISCAERAFPVIDEIACQNSKRSCHDLLDALWDPNVNIGQLDIPALRASLESLPEASCDDSWNPDYYANRALSVIILALASMERSAKALDRETAAISGVELASGLDAKLAPESATPRMVGADEEEESGPLQAGEVRHQAELLEELMNGVDITPNLLKTHRTRCLRASAPIRRAAKEILGFGPSGPE